MVNGVERLGNYEVRPMGDGTYHVSTTVPGHVGAGIWDEAGVQTLRDKYNNQNGDEFVSNKPKMSEEKANLITMMPPTALAALLFNDDYKEALDARRCYAEQEGTKTNKTVSTMKTIGKSLLAAVAGFGLGKFGGKLLAKFIK